MYTSYCLISRASLQNWQCNSFLLILFSFFFFAFILASLFPSLLLSVSKFNSLSCPCNCHVSFCVLLSYSATDCCYCYMCHSGRLGGWPTMYYHLLKIVLAATQLQGAENTAIIILYYLQIFLSINQNLQLAMPQYGIMHK